MESDGEGPLEDRQNNMQDNADDGTGLGQIIQYEQNANGRNPSNLRK